MMNFLLKYQLVILGIVFNFVFIAPGFSEFYRYVDKDGRVKYVDDVSKIPNELVDTAKVYKEKYDHLPESERAAVMEAEKRQEQERMLFEKKREEEIEKEANLKRLETKVVIEGNRVLVPVILENGIYKVTANLVLDTGATIIALHRNIAEKLHFSYALNEKARVASGEFITIRLVKLSRVQVGAIYKTDLYAGIIHHEGVSENHDGLLGMNFLRNLDYSINFDTQTIRWKTEP